MQQLWHCLNAMYCNIDMYCFNGHTDFTLKQCFLCLQLNVTNLEHRICLHVRQKVTLTSESKIPDLRTWIAVLKTKECPRSVPFHQPSEIFSLQIFVCRRLPYASTRCSIGPFGTPSGELFGLRRILRIFSLIGVVISTQEALARFEWRRHLRHCSFYSLWRGGVLFSCFLAREVWFQTDAGDASFALLAWNSVSVTLASYVFNFKLNSDKQRNSLDYTSAAMNP